MGVFQLALFSVLRMVPDRDHSQQHSLNQFSCFSSQTCQTVPETVREREPQKTILELLFEQEHFIGLYKI